MGECAAACDRDGSACATAWPAPARRRFDLQEVKESKPLKKGQPAKPLTAWAPSKDGQQGGSHKLRYVDGVPVHTSQKYVIEKVQPDWDGGSKGGHCHATERAAACSVRVLLHGLLPLPCPIPPC